MNAQIVLENVGIRLPSRVLFEDINWSLYEGMRVALAGRNGAGKSTLLSVIAGQTDSTEGKRTVVGGKRLSVGYLDQRLLDSAVLEAMDGDGGAVTPAAYLIADLERENPESEPAEIEWETRKILSGLGFSPEWMDSPMGNLSGGWLLRVFIARALLRKPHVLLLDEPTNHLDISSIQWLEEFLQKEYTGSLVLVTHDVSLQRRVTDSLAIIHGGRFFFQKTAKDYLAFKDSLVEEKRILEKNIEALQKKVDENMEFVYKFRAKAQTAARAQSKLKAAEAYQEEQKQLKERLARIEGNAYNLHFRFRLAGAGSKFPLSTKGLNFRYSDSGPWLLKNLNVDISRGQRVAIIGDNGTGKTTLLNLLGNRLKPVEGELAVGAGVEQGFFGQHQLDELMLDGSVYDNVRAKALGMGMEEIRGWLGAFGFSGNDEIDKKARVLSGGEKARLALLRILVTRINLVLLDEPTNHLDVETKELLKQAMNEFEGTTIFVSHDRDFIRDVAQRILYLSHDHKLIDHIGNLDSFFEKYPELVRHAEGKAKASRPSQAPVGDVPAKPAAPKISYEERKKLKNQLRSLQKKIQANEQEMERLGAEKQTLPPDAFSRFQEIETKLVALMVDWEKWSTEVEGIRKVAPDLE